MKNILAIIASVLLVAACMPAKPQPYELRGAEKAKAIRVETRMAEVVLADLQEGIDGELENFETLTSDATVKLADLMAAHDTMRVRIYASRLYMFRMKYKTKLDDIASHSTEVMEFVSALDNLPTTFKVDENATTLLKSDSDTIITK